MAEKYRMAKGFLPKPICLKRVSASCASPSDWINISIHPSDCGPKSTRKRVETRYIADTSSVWSDQPNVSPASSPEFDYMLGASHEFLGIEVDEQQSAPTVSSSLCISEPGSCCGSQNSATIPSISAPSQHLPSENAALAFNDCDFESFDYLNLLQRDNFTAPYINLFRKPTRHKDTKSELVSRISLLARRSYSDRSVWLNRHTISSGYDSSIHKSRTFRILKCGAGQFSGVPGLRQLKVVEFYAHETTEDPVEYCDADTRPVSSIILPVSDCSSVLGDTISPNDIVRVYSPWITSTDPSEPQSVVLYSFFWVERLKPSETAVFLEAISSSESLETASISLACQCCVDSSNQDFRSCCFRFRAVNDVGDSVCGSSFALESLKNPIIVLCAGQLWLTQKIRHVLIVLHHTLGIGVIVMPTTGEPIAKIVHHTFSPIQAHSLCIDDMKLGGLYSVENLFQLPANQLPQRFQEDVCTYFADIRRISCDASVRKLSQFVENWDTAHSGSSTCYPYCVWDARVASFKLAHSNYLRVSDPQQFSDTLPWLTRCTLDGLLLSEIPEGSLLFVDVIQRIRSSVLTVASSSESNLCRLKRSIGLATRLFFLLLTNHGVATKTVVPCICLSGVPSPLTVLHSINLQKHSTGHILLKSYGSRLVVTNAYTGPGCVFVDFLASIRTWNKRPLSDAMVSNLPATNIVYAPVDSADKVNCLQLYDLIHFSGTIVAVDTSRSHTWPLCTLCLSDNLKPHYTQHPDGEGVYSANSVVSPNCTVFDCSTCGSRIVGPFQSFELEVSLTLDVQEGETSARPHILLVMSSVRLFKLLGLPLNSWPKHLQLDPRLMVSKHIEHVSGLVVELNDKSPLSSHPVHVKRAVTVLDLGFDAFV